MWFNPQINSSLNLWDHFHLSSYRLFHSIHLNEECCVYGFASKSLQAKCFNKYSVSNWLLPERSACSRRGYWLSRKLKYLNVEGDRCCMRTGGNHKKHTCGRKVDVGSFTLCASYRETTVASLLLLHRKQTNQCCHSWNSFIFFNESLTFRGIPSAHRTADA